MFEKSQKLDVSTSEFAVIEAALHTQAQILNVQASAGGNAARDRLNEVKRVLSTLAQQKPTQTRDTCTGGSRWMRMARLFS